MSRASVTCMVAAANAAARVVPRLGRVSVPSQLLCHLGPRTLATGSAPSRRALSPPMPLFVRLPGATMDEEVAVTGPRISHIRDAVETKFNITFRDVRPDQLEVMLGDDGVALDPMTTLSDAGIGPCSKVTIVIKSALPELPAPLTFKPVELNGEKWYRATRPLDDTGSFSAPLYLTEEQQVELQRFIHELPSFNRPRLLMPVGTLKSGKSTVLQVLLPGMLSAAYKASWPATRRRPVIFHYNFPRGAAPEPAAIDLSKALARFGRSIGVRYDYVDFNDAGEALSNLPINLGSFAERIKAAGGELWLLLDGLQGPGLHASTSWDAQFFAGVFKDVVELVSPYGRVVATGTGSMVTLLESIRALHVNSFVLWSSISFLKLGREPSSAAAHGMTDALLEAYSARWPEVAKGPITTEKVLGALAPDAHGGLTSRRPALVAYVLERIGDAQGADSAASAEELLRAAVRDALVTLKADSTRDTARFLASLDNVQRKALRAVEAGAYSRTRLEAIRKGEQQFAEGRVGVHAFHFAALIECLSEEFGDSTLHLQPPYAALFQSWIRPGGDLAVRSNKGKAS